MIALCSLEPRSRMFIVVAVDEDGDDVAISQQIGMQLRPALEFQALRGPGYFVVALEDD